ncbi:MAG: hypothetical protein JSS32_07675 [Verrucomicrobia bacterium]|nr:hypothetical protein [Verrucomicrobiota bacterium]
MNQTGGISARGESLFIGASELPILSYARFYDVSEETEKTDAVVTLVCLTYDQKMVAIDIVFKTDSLFRKLIQELQLARIPSGRCELQFVSKAHRWIMIHPHCLTVLEKRDYTGTYTLTETSQITKYICGDVRKQYGEYGNYVGLGHDDFERIRRI